MSRRRARTDRPQGQIAQLPFGQFTMPYQPIKVISDDQVMTIHEAALTILRDIGFNVLEPTARAHYQRGGATIAPGGTLMKFDPEMVMEWVSKAPPAFSLHARDPAKTLRLGGQNGLFSAVGGPAYVSDLDRGRRPGTYAEQCDFLRLVQSLNILHQEGGGPFEALDLPHRTRHLDLYLAQCTLLDKNWQPIGLGRDMAIDALDMAAISYGLSREALTERCVFTCIINTNSPLQLDIPMAEGLITFAENNQCAVVTPFTLSGAMSPVTLAGALAQQHAEALAGIALTQIVRPGCPVIYGGFTSNVDMKSGAPAFGTPEYTQAAHASGQLARLLNLPFRSSNVNAANAIDAQAAYESMMALWGAIMGGAHLINHAAGWMNGGLTASFEKLIIDAEMLQMMQAYCQPMQITPDTLALEAIREVGPGGHFFGTAHTLARYETAFHTPMISNWDNYDSWMERGAETAPQRANTVWKQLLAEYQPPPIDPATEEALNDFVARRKLAYR